MPYTIKKTGDEYCVHKKGADGEATGKSLGCHPTKKEAVAQIGAIESSLKRQGKSILEGLAAWFGAIGKQTESLQGVVDNIREAWYKHIGDDEWQHWVVDIYEGYIIVRGSADDSHPYYKVAYTEDEGTYTFVVRGEWVGGDLVFTEEAAQIMGFQVLPDNKWVAVWNNAFQDKKGQIFPRAAHADFSDWANGRGIYEGLGTHMPTLRLIHMPGSDIGIATYIETYGVWQLAAGTFDNTSLAMAAQEGLRNKNWTASHGYVFDTRQKKDGVFARYRTFEISVVPPGWEANEYTGFKELGTMAVDKSSELYKGLVSIIGEEQTDALFADLDGKEDAIKSLGVAFKTLSTEPEESKKPVELPDEFLAGVKSLVASVASVSDVMKQLATAQATQETQTKTLQENVDSLSKRIDLAVEKMNLPAAALQPEQVGQATDGKALSPASDPDPAKASEPKTFGAPVMEDLFSKGSEVKAEG